MKLILISLLMIIILMLFVQSTFRENLTNDSTQREFRQDIIDYTTKQFRLIPYNGKEVECNYIGQNGEMKTSDFCEGFTPIERTKYSKMAESCSEVNEIVNWRSKVANIPTNTIKDENGKKKGCGYCFDSDNVWYGDDSGPFKNVGGSVCPNWVKPGTKGDGGGSSHKKNIEVEYPSFDGDFSTNDFNQGVVYDSVKLNEQKICKSMKNCADSHGEKDVCGWCPMGRKSDGIGEGMVRDENNETKYGDDYCPWPREVDGDGNKTVFYGKEKGKKNEELRNWKKWPNIGTTGRLIGSLKQCAALDQAVPCLKNWNGNKKDENGNIKHSKECYDDMWENNTTYKNGDANESCTGNIEERLDAHLPPSETFFKWDGIYIPTVEGIIQDIPRKWKFGKQYAENYTPTTFSEETDKAKAIMWMKSARANGLACVNEEVNPCEDRFRDRTYGYHRPKNCILTILDGKGVEPHYTFSKYEPGKSETFKYFWAVEKDKEWRDGIHYDWTDDVFKKKLQDKLDIYLATDIVKRDGVTWTGKKNNYDEILSASMYLYGRIKDDIKIWKDVSGVETGTQVTTTRKWVKMCWEDFKLAMKRKYGGKMKNFITKKGEIDISQDAYISANILSNDNYYHDILTYTDPKTNILVKVNIESGLIKEADYLHRHFPFWRLLDPVDYVTSLYNKKMITDAEVVRIKRVRDDKDNLKFASELLRDRGF